MKLLIVDDSPKIRIMLKSMYGFIFDEIFEAENGLEAVKLYKQHLPDWVLMDIKMELMDGLEATKKIKEFDNNARIIIVTLFDDKLLRQEAINSGAYEFILKNNLTKIEDILEEAL